MQRDSATTTATSGHPDEFGILPSNGAQPLWEFLQALPAAIYATDTAGRLTFYNEAAVKLWGCRPELGSSQWCGPWHLFWPDGRPMPHHESPMAIALRQGQPLKGADAVAERPDGSRVPFLAYPTPLRDDKGAIVGAVNMLVDITDRKLEEISKQLLAAIVESSDDAIVSKDLNGTITSWNEGAERIFGYAREEAVGRSITMLIPSDRHAEETEILGRIRSGDRIEHYETVRLRKDGRFVDVSLTVSPVRNIEGRIVGASKIARDITERKKLQERQDLLLREMNHRVKNSFALAVGLVALSARAAGAPRDYVDVVRERLNALSRAHELTMPALTAGHEPTDRSTTLYTLLRTIIAPYIDSIHGGDERIVLSGPDVAIGGSASTGLALLLHEFATNAVRHGALSSQGGGVNIDWAVRGDELVLNWEEHGGPALDGPPVFEGFGSVLARATVGSQFGGEISRDWKPEGLTVRLSVRLARLTT